MLTYDKYTPTNKGEINHSDIFVKITFLTFHIDIPERIYNDFLNQQ